MEHSYAVEHHLVEQYLLDELSPEVRDDFEEHFFDCQECAADLRVTDDFLKTARAELRDAAVAPEQEPVRHRWPLQSLLEWRPAYALMALAACLMIVVYQNSVTVPRLRSEVAKVETPSILPSVSLVGGNSRGGAMPSAPLNGANAVLLQVDVPTQERFTNYVCSLYTRQHQLIWAVRVSAEQAKNTVSIRAPLKSSAGGSYLLEIQGNQDQSNNSAVSGTVLASYPFMLNGGSTGTGD